MAGQDSSLSTLLKRATIEDHEEILQACISKLKQSKKDGTAQHAKVVALLKLERYEDALRVLEESGEAHQNIARLEKAYALYKHGEFQEAQLISQDIANDRGARHIEAQAVCVLRFQSPVDLLISLLVVSVRGLCRCRQTVQESYQ